MIAEVAKAVQSVLREYDVVMRYPGDEFVGIAPLRTSESLQTLNSRGDAAMSGEKLNKRAQRESPTSAGDTADGPTLTLTRCPKD